MYLWNHSDETFFSEGEIDELNRTTAFIVFEGITGKEEILSFWLDDGNSYKVTGGNYYAIPAVEFEQEDSSKKVRDTKTTTEKKSRSTGDTDTSKGTASTISNVIDLQDQRDVKKSQSNETKEKQTESSDEPKDKDVPEEFIQVSFGNLNVDASNNYGGAFVTDSEMDYDGVTAADINAMDYQERFDFYMTNPETSFNMFQDLVEYVCIVDQEINEDEQEIAYYHGIECAYETDEDEAAERILN